MYRYLFAADGSLDISTFLSAAVVIILAFAYHEFAHAIVADRLGDPTPRSFGRITLNPIPHLDRFGLVMLFIAGFGWATTPVNPNYLSGNPRRSMALVAVAGPAANFLMAVLFAIPLRIVQLELIPGNVMPDWLFTFFVLGVQWNIILMLFNLLPIPPLDGFTILLGILPADLAYQLMPLRQYGVFILLGLLFIPPLLGFPGLFTFLGPAINFLFQLLTGLPFNIY